MRTGRYQPFPFRIDDGAKSFQCACTKKTQITRSRENDFINGFESIDSENRVANITSYDYPIRHLEFLITLFHFDSYFRQYLFGKPSEFGTSIYNELFD